MKTDEKKMNFSQEKERKAENVQYDLEESKVDFVHESSAAYEVRGKRQGEYTIEDYRNWPAEERVELIDGEIIRMEAPNFNHQAALADFNMQVYNYILQKKGKCRALISPLDVQLDEDDKTMLQPDFIILCDEKKIRRWGIYGAPDFVLEILSPSTRTYDMVRKKNKYLAAGVKEYWILDLEKEKLVTYTKIGGHASAIYPLQGKVGVALYENDLEIDLDWIRERLYRE